MAGMAQAMMARPWVTGGTDLGTETYSRDDNGADPAFATARFNFNTAGTVTVSGVGTGAITSAPFTGWNTNGGTHLSYELLSQSILTAGEPNEGSITFTGGLLPSDAYGLNRHNVSSALFQVIANATFDSGSGDSQPSEASVKVKVSIWDAATGGTRKAFGIYTVAASDG